MADIVELVVFGKKFYSERASLECIQNVLNDEYHIRCLQNHDVKFVLDIGAHVGTFTCIAHHLWPNATIISIEPSPSTFELLKKNTEHISSDKHVLINAAIGPTEADTHFCITSHDTRVGDFSAEIWDELDPRKTDLQVVTKTLTPEALVRLCDSIGATQIEVMKIDCEGAEYMLLDRLSELRFLGRVVWIRGEWHIKQFNARIGSALSRTHVFNIDNNEPWYVGPFIAHRKHIEFLPDQVCKDSPLEPKKKRLVISLATEWHRSRLEYTEERMRLYAERCDADFHLIEDDAYPAFPMANKWRIVRLAEKYDEVLYVDSDVLIRRDAPSIFECDEVRANPDAEFFAFDEWTVDHFHHRYSNLCNEQECWFALINKKSPGMGFNGGVILFRKNGLNRYLPRGPFQMNLCADQWWLTSEAIENGKFGKLGISWNAPASLYLEKNYSPIWFFHALTDRKDEYLNTMNAVVP